jgi:hypothetical protein
MEIISFTAFFYPYYFAYSWYNYFTSSSDSLCFLLFLIVPSLSTFISTYTHIPFLRQDSRIFLHESHFLLSLLVKFTL